MNRTSTFGHNAVSALLASACIVASTLTTAPAPARAGCFTSTSTGSDEFVATFDSCNNGGAVTTDIKTNVTGQHFNIRFGQRAKSDAGLGPVYSGQRERNANQPFYVWGTRPKNVPVIAYFEYQNCYYAGTFSRYSCTAWVPIQIDLGYFELKAYS